MCVDVDASVLALFQKLLNVVEVVAADENARTVAHANIHLGDFWVAVSGRIGFVEQCHCLHAPFASFQDKSGEFIGIVAGHQLAKGLQNELIDVAIDLTKASGVFQVGGHTFEAVHGQLFQRADVLVGFGKHADGLGFLVILLAGAIPFQYIKFREHDAFLVGHSVFEHFAQFQAFIDTGVDALRVEVGVGDGRKQCVVHEGVDTLAEIAIIVSTSVLVMVGDDAQSFKDID